MRTGVLPLKEDTEQTSSVLSPRPALTPMTMSAKNVFNEYTLPHIEANTAAVGRVKVPPDRKALFLVVDNETLHDKLSDELSFSGLSSNERATFQFLLYLTYCCKGEVFQVTLENTDFRLMSPPIREDFSHGRLFCFVLDMSNEDPCETAQSGPGALDVAECTSSSQLIPFADVSIDMDVFRQEHDGHEPEEESYPGAASAEVTEVLDEAFNAFMRLQLVRNRASSLNNAMIVMRDRKEELSSMFNWVDIRSDTLNSNNVDKKKVKELQGSLYTPAHSGRQVVLPEPIKALNLKALENAIGRITDSSSDGEGKALFLSIMAKLTSTQWTSHRVVQTSYNADMPQDMKFVEKLKGFTTDISGCSSRSGEVDIRGLLVFRYSLVNLIDRDTPDLFVKSLIHRHVPVTNTRIDTVLCDIRSKRRTRALATLLTSGQCLCRRNGHRGACSGKCQTAYSCFYNSSECHPFTVSKDDHSYYFARLYPHLGKLERLSKEMKVKYGGLMQFNSIADLVFNILIRHKFNNSLYDSLSDVMGVQIFNSSLSLGHSLGKIHRSLYLDPGYQDSYREDPRALSPLKVYDHALVRYLFSDSLQVGRLFQASTTFNYVIANTAPRYTIERIMLFNITGPGEGKSYANYVLNYMFRKVSGCIETLTSFTPQAFKYKHKRDACVVMIDDAHISHEKNVKSIDRESNVIPNTFKNLLDTSVLESDVVMRDQRSGQVDTVKCQAVHNCGFVWNTNTLGFVSDAWADRCLVMESEFPESSTRTRGTKQIQDTVDGLKMERIAAVCLYRQNLIQSATMITDSAILQFSARFDNARDTCVAALYASHIVCTGAVSRRVSFCINQLVFAEAMKLACHFVFDIWIPPWTEIPDANDYPELEGYMEQMNNNRLTALNELSFGEICLETNAVNKLCTAACLPDICPRVLDTQGRFACKVLGYILRQIHEQHLKTCSKSGHLCISGIDAMFFSENEIKGGADVAHQMLSLCSTCKVPARKDIATKNYKLCTCRYAANQNAPRGRGHSSKKIGSVTIPLEAVYDMLAIYAPKSHSGFWDQLGAAMVAAYEKGDFQEVNAFGQVSNDDSEQQPTPRLKFTLDFNADPVRSVILDATVSIEPLAEITFNKCVLGGEMFQCSAPLYYGAVIRRALRQNAPKEACDERHLTESKKGPRGTFHGPRLSVCSSAYSGVPVANMSSFCTTRTVYHQDKIFLRPNAGNRGHVEIEEDWEWKDAVDVFSHVHGTDVFSVKTLKRDYAATMMVTKGEMPDARSDEPTKLRAMLRTLQQSDGRGALNMRKLRLDTQQSMTPRGVQGNRKRAHLSTDDRLRLTQKKKIPNDSTRDTTL